jgi:hypothetical protein
MYGSFMPGSTPEHLDDSINAVISTFKDPIFISRDGSNFDSH